MDKKSKILLVIFSFLVLISVFLTYYRYVILGDFVILTDEEAFNKALSEQ